MLCDKMLRMVEQTAITLLLKRWSAGETQALEPLSRAVHDELRRCAGRHLARRTANHTLQPTALINEAWVRLISQEQPPKCEDRAHFFGLASRLMRFVLVDHARARRAVKRGPAAGCIALDAGDIPIPNRVTDILEVNEALDRLSAHDDRKARIIDMRYFGGMAREEIAVAMGLTLATVKRDLRLGEAWLSRFMSHPEAV